MTAHASKAALLVLVTALATTAVVLAIGSALGFDAPRPPALPPVEEAVGDGGEADDPDAEAHAHHHGHERHAERHGEHAEAHGHDGEHAHGHEHDTGCHAETESP